MPDQSPGACLNLASAEQIRLSAMHELLSPQLTFEEASDIWLQSRNFAGGKVRSRYIKPRTLASYTEYLKPLNRFFGPLVLSQIHFGHIREYQVKRAMGELGTPDDELFARVCRWERIPIYDAYADPVTQARIDFRVKKLKHVEVGPNKINQETDTLVQILRQANTWTEELDSYYERLQREESDIRKALTPAEQKLWLDTAASEERWAVVYLYSVVAFRSTASNVEMRGLRIGDVNTRAGTISVQASHAKNRFRLRTIAIPGDAVLALERLLTRAEELGSYLPNHYVFPFRDHKGKWKPEQSMTVSGLKKLWNEVRAKSGLLHFRQHDTRHTAITRLAEAGTPIPVIMSMAGHISRKMMQHYTQISDQAQRWAVEAVYHGRFYPPQNAPKSPLSEKPVHNWRKPLLVNS